jgi:hypothetical protein
MSLVLHASPVNFQTERAFPTYCIEDCLHSQTDFPLQSCVGLDSICIDQPQLQGSQLENAKSGKNIFGTLAGLIYD